jgi:hypothetical protein
MKQGRRKKRDQCEFEYPLHVAIVAREC